MLRSLKINNIALIDECHIQFDSGFNVLTGETGAGKSIIIDSINFVLGSRSDKSLIKHGKETARVEAVFDIDEDTRPIFEEMGLEWESVLIITRVFSINGKSECRINGNIATLGMLKKITSHIVDVFGQNDHAILLDENAHLDMLDQFASPDLNKKKVFSFPAVLLAIFSQHYIMKEIHIRRFSHVYARSGSCPCPAKNP